MAKILVVDDSEIVRNGLASCLKKESFEVLEAADGEKGYQCALSNRDIKLIISDFNMPVLDGLSMCRMLMQAPGYIAPPILMLTTEFDAQMKLEGKKCGVVAWLTKPYAEGVLLVGVRNIIAKFSKV